MKTGADIKNLYTPVQPSLKKSVEQVTYQEFLPAERLQNLVYCYWELKSNLPLSRSFHYTVVADGCIDIFFELTNPQENFQKNSLSFRSEVHLTISEYVSYLLHFRSYLKSTHRS